MTAKSPAAQSPHHDRRKGRLLAVAGAVGGIVAVLAPTPDEAGLVGRVLIGFVVAALGFAVPLLRRILRADPEQTRSYVQGLDPGLSMIDGAVLLGSIGSLAGVAFMLATQATRPSERLGEALIALAAVASGWVLVHTMFALRYARHWFNAEPGCIDFNSDNPDFAPSYSDFLYLALAIGSSFAVSDTNVKTTRLRRITIRHSLVAYLFGTVIVASTINLLAGLTF